jgi:hypothetical protein
MEEDVRLIVLEHLGDELNVHVLDIDLLRSVNRPNATSRPKDVLEGSC